MLQFTYASGGYLRGADYDQKHSYRSCCPHSLYFCRFGRATDSSSRRDECKCQCGCVSGRLAGLLLTMLGQIPNYRDPHVRGLGHGRTSQGFHVVTFVKRLICRNARDKRRQIVFKMGQAGNGEKP
jgi:hypothetical protein